MKQLRFVLLLCVCLLMPSLAHADDGGWWDSFWKFDAKLHGVNVEFHLLCLDQLGRRVIGCEENFRGLLPFLKGELPVHDFAVVKNPNDPPNAQVLVPTKFEDIKHEINLRVGYYHTYPGTDRYSAPDPSIEGSINATKLMLTHHYHLNKYLAIGGGVGYISVGGDRIERFWRLNLMPVSYLVTPMPDRPRLGAMVLRVEVNYIPQGFTAVDFGDGPDPRDPNKTVSNYSNKNEWSAVFGVGFDLRRIGSVRAR